MMSLASSSSSSSSDCYATAADCCEERRSFLYGKPPGFVLTLYDGLQRTCRDVSNYTRSASRRLQMYPRSPHSDCAMCSCRLQTKTGRERTLASCLLDRGQSVYLTNTPLLGWDVVDVHVVLLVGDIMNPSEENQLRFIIQQTVSISSLLQASIVLT